ncbi:MAG TPA: TetR/AcrR family transcriptional regulator [Acidimicrobiales bacterium]|nr:TetR/AcrR family transcriptional regulator [Acidimicrobiales bacterium]
MPADLPTTKRVRMSREARRHQLLDAAAGLLVEIGPDNLTVEGLAAHAGVSKALPYAYFANADEIVDALFAREMGALDERVAQEVRAADTFDDRIRATLNAICDVVLERGALVATLLTPRPGTLGEQQRRRQENRQAFFGALVREEFEIPEPTATYAVVMCMGATAEMVGLVAKGIAERDEIVDLYITMWRRGLEGVAERVRNQPS